MDQQFIELFGTERVVVRGEYVIPFLIIFNFNFLKCGICVIVDGFLNGARLRMG
jgi:hypothetical protein